MTLRVVHLFGAFVSNFLDGGGKIFSWENIKPIYRYYLYQDGKLPNLDKEFNQLIHNLKDDECIGYVYASDYFGYCVNICFMDKNNQWHFSWDEDNFPEKDNLSFSKKSIQDTDYYTRDDFLKRKILKKSQFKEMVVQWQDKYTKKEDLDKLKKLFFDTVSI